MFDLQAMGQANGLMGFISGGLKMAGGIFQANEIQRQTMLRIQQMQRAGFREYGAAEAAGAASGAEMSSSAIQNLLHGLSAESNRRIAEVRRIGGQAADNAMLAGIGSAFSAFGKNLYDTSKTLDAIGEKPLVGPAPIPGPTQRNPITWNW